MPRPKDTPNTTQMLQVARLFYRDQKSKQEIARLLKVDSRKVTSLLKEAVDLGVVRINIHGRVESDLEHKLYEGFPHLKKVMIVPGLPIHRDHYKRAVQDLAVLAADYFDELVSKNSSHKRLHIGISGGEALLEFVRAVPDRLRNDVDIHATAIVGRGSSELNPPTVDASTNATMLWTKCGSLPGRCHYANLTPYDPSTLQRGETAREFFANQLHQAEQNSIIRSVLQGMDGIDVAFADLGDYRIRPSGKTEAGFTVMSVLNPLITLQQLADEGAVGDLSYCVFDKNGNTHDSWRRLALTAGHFSQQPGIDFYKNMVGEGKTVVVIAGLLKEPALKVALKAKAFNVLITDEHTARQIEFQYRVDSGRYE